MDQSCIRKSSHPKRCVIALLVVALTCSHAAAQSTPLSSPNGHPSSPQMLEQSPEATGADHLVLLYTSSPELSEAILHPHRLSMLEPEPKEELQAWDLPTTAPSVPSAGDTARHFENRKLELFVQQPTMIARDARPTDLDTSSFTANSLDTYLTEPVTPLEQRPPTLLRRLLRDQVNFYAPESLVLIGGGFAAGAVLANTSLDRDIQSHLQSSLHNANTDDWLEGLHANKELGDGFYTLPIFAGAWAVGNMLPDAPATEATRIWGERSLRGFLLGAPPLIVMQLATGGSRPGESSHGSEWAPFQDDNGVSGHSFMGALPFITAAKMTDRVGLKGVFYAASTLTPLSRAADSAHYPSQVALGWWMAYISASAVQMTDRPRSHWRLFPTTVANGSGMALEYKF